MPSRGPRLIRTRGCLNSRRQNPHIHVAVTPPQPCAAAGNQCRGGLVARWLHFHAHMQSGGVAAAQRCGIVVLLRDGRAFRGWV